MQTGLGPPSAAFSPSSGAAGNRTRYQNQSAETLIASTGNDAIQREKTCGYVEGVDGINTRTASEVSARRVVPMTERRVEHP